MYQWERKELERLCRERFPDKKQFRHICLLLRIMLTGSDKSPPIFEVMEILGEKECMKRVAIVAKHSLNVDINYNEALDD